MRQGDGSDLLGPGDPRNADIGILYVESMDSRQDILLAISTQELQGRKQIAIVLPEQRKAFRQPVDFDGLKNMRRSLKAQLVFIAPPGPGPAEFARQRRFMVYSTLDSFKNALLNERVAPAPGRAKSNPGGAQRPRLLGFGSRKARKPEAEPPALPPTPPTPRLQGQNAPVDMPPTPPTPRLQGQLSPQEMPPTPPTPRQQGRDAPATPVLPPAPPTPRLQDQQVPPTPISEQDTIEVEPKGKDPNKGKAAAAAAGAAAGMLAAGALENDDDALYTAPGSQAPQGGPISPIASGSATPGGPAVGPGRGAKPPSKPLENRPAPGIIAFPSVPPATPRITGKINPAQGKRGSGKLSPAQGSPQRESGKLPEQHGSGKIPAVQGQRGSGKLPAGQGAQGGPNAQNQPDDAGGRGNTGKVAAVAAGAALGAAAMGGGPQGGSPVATAAAPGGAPAPAAGAGGRASIGQRQAGLTPLPPPYSRRSRRSRGRRLLLWGAILIVLSALLAVSIIEARGGFSTFIGNTTATVTITPASKLEQDSYILEGVPTGTPDPAQRQIAARVLKQTSPTQSATGNATGSIPATQARGQLIFFNGTRSGVTLGTTVLTGADGVQVKFNGPVFVPATGSASATATGFAVNAGAQGNIPALDIAGPCCSSGITVKNTSAFSGGQNAVANSVIQQSDIDNAAKPLVNSLSQSTQSALQKQVKSNERVVDGSFKCQPTTTADHKAGDVAKSVNVQVSVTCTEETYDFAAAQQMVTNLLRTKAQNDPGLSAQYALDGQIVTSILSDTIVSAQGQLNIDAQAQGLWVYGFTNQMQQNIKQELVKHTKADALNILTHQQGVAGAKITISSGNIMPTNASDITLVIVNLPGVQPSPTGSPTGVTPGPTPRITPTPTIGLGGS